MKLYDYLSGWKQLIQDNQVVDMGLEPEVTTLYREFVQHHYLDILRKVYARLDECMDCPWEQWRDGYFQQYPPYAWELNQLAQSFPAYLAAGQLVAEDLIELTRYEWAEFLVHTQNSVPAKISRGQYALNPARQLLELSFDIAGWIFNWEQEHGQAPLEGRAQPGCNVLVISRHFTTFNCIMTRCDYLDLTIYQALALAPCDFEQLWQSCQAAVTEVSTGGQLHFTPAVLREKLAFLTRQFIVY